MIKHSLDEHADALADYSPNGILFESKKIGSSNYRQLLRGIAGELFTAEGYLVSLNDDYLPDKTVLFIEEWESALGIPDSCFSGAGTLIERRRDVLVKLASLGVQTIDDFQELADTFGISATVRSGIDLITFPLTFPIFMFNTSKEARFTIVVDFTDVAANTFPLTFPFTFGTEALRIVECLFNKLKPANCNIIFRQV